MKSLLTHNQLNVTHDRLSFQLAENNEDFKQESSREEFETLVDFGWPENVELSDFVDGQFRRELSIQSDSLGLTVDVVVSQKVKMIWEEGNKDNKIVLAEA